MRFVTVDRFCPKSCCEFVMLNFTDEINLSKINFSNTFEISISRLIGRLFETSCLSPSLKIGIISVIFQVDGKTHLLEIVLKIRKKDLEIEQFSFFRKNDS